MEGVAARAGVSKALGYRYFENADQLLVALHDREMAEIGIRVRAAMASTTGYENQCRASLAAWLDLLAERGTVIATVMAVRPVSGPVEDASRAIHATFTDYYAKVVAAEYGLSPTLATVASSIQLAGLHGLLHCWINGRMSRRELIDTFATMSAAAFAALADRPPMIGEPSTPIETV